MKTLFPLILLLAVIMNGCGKKVPEWTIVPGESVGPIDMNTTEAELKDIFGEENVVRSKIHIGEGSFLNGTTIYKGTRNEIELVWSGSYEPPIERVIINGEGARWQSNTGVKIGTSLKKLNEINGKPFVFYGFGWDYGGSVLSWEGGALDSAGATGTLLYVRLNYRREPGEDEMNQVLGEIELRSDLELLEKLNCYVAHMEIVFADSSTEYAVVLAESGLSMRAKPSTTAEKYTNLPLNTKVKILNPDGPEETIEGVSAHWYEVEVDGQKGWVFGGFVDRVQ